jgi:hypothetical protein
MEIQIDWVQLFSNFGSSVVIAIITAIITVRLALNRFYAEKWWERKYSSYASVIESLHHVKNHADTNLTFALRNREISAEGDAHLNSKLEGAMAELRMQLDIGAFLLSKEAVNVMNKLMLELEQSTSVESWQEHLELKIIAVNKCLPRMRLIARNELNAK